MKIEIWKKIENLKFWKLEIRTLSVPESWPIALSSKEGACIVSKETKILMIVLILFICDVDFRRLVFFAFSLLFRLFACFSAKWTKIQWISYRGHHEFTFDLNDVRSSHILYSNNFKCALYFVF